MLLSHECPRDLLYYLEQYNDYNYYLDVFMLDRQYNTFFQKSSKPTYLDCSLYERTMTYTIERLDLGIYKALCQKLIKDGIDIYCIVPDYKDRSKKCINELENFTDIKKKIVGVHGKNYEDYRDCFNYYCDHLDLENTIIALSSIDDFSDIETRTKFLSSENTEGVKIHVFGLCSPEEIKLLSEVKDKIYSLDTSLPVTATIAGVEIEQLVEKPKMLIYEIFDNETNIDENLLDHNVQYIHSWLK